MNEKVMIPLRDQYTVLIYNGETLVAEVSYDGEYHMYVDYTTGECAGDLADHNYVRPEPDSTTELRDWLVFSYENSTIWSNEPYQARQLLEDLGVDKRVTILDTPARDLMTLSWIKEHIIYWHDQFGGTE